MHHGFPEIYTYDTHQTAVATALGLKPVAASPLAVNVSLFLEQRFGKAIDRGVEINAIMLDRLSIKSKELPRFARGFFRLPLSLSRSTSRHCRGR